MTLGTKDKKKVAILAVLGLVVVWQVYTNLLSGPDVPATSTKRERATAENPIVPTSGGGPAAPNISRSRIRTGDSGGFHPVLHKIGDEKNRPDPSTIDPTLRRDRLEAVQAVELAGGARNLFQYGTPPAAKPKLPEGEEPKVPVVAWQGPKPPTPPAPPPPPPPPPPIPLKFYAFWVARDDGRRTACFLDGEDILMAREGETLKRRYRVIRINPSSVVMEDLEVKKQQTLQLVEEAATQGE